MAEQLLRIDEKTRMNGQKSYTVALRDLCLFESSQISEVIKFVQELNFEASLLLLNLRTKELNAR